MLRDLLFVIGLSLIVWIALISLSLIDWIALWVTKERKQKGDDT